MILACKKGEFMSERFSYVRGEIQIKNISPGATLEDVQSQDYLDVRLTYKGEYKTNEFVEYQLKKDEGNGWSFHHTKTMEDMKKGDAVPALLRMHLIGLEKKNIEGDEKNTFISGSFISHMPTDAGLWGVNL